MKKILFTEKETNKTKDCLGGEIGEKVFALCNNVKETNNAIRWCNTHKAGETFEDQAGLYKLEIHEI